MLIRLTTSAFCCWFLMIDSSGVLIATLEVLCKIYGLTEVKNNFSLLNARAIRISHIQTPEVNFIHYTFLPFSLLFFPHSETRGWNLRGKKSVEKNEFPLSDSLFVIIRNCFCSYSYFFIRSLHGVCSRGVLFDQKEKITLLLHISSFLCGNN